MARLRQLVELRNDAYQLADLQNATSRFPTSEVNYYINDGVASFYDLLVRARGPGYFEKNVIIIPNGVDTNYALPIDFYEIILAQCNLGFTTGATADTNIALHQFNMAERPELSSYTPGWQGNPFGYRIHGGDPAVPGQIQGQVGTGYTIEFLPKPAPGLKIYIFYIPSCPLLVNDNDNLDTINGWDRYVSVHAAILMRTKDDLPVDTLQGLKAEMKERINGLAARRDTTPTRVVDVRYQFPGRGWRRQRRA